MIFIKLFLLYIEGVISLKDFFSQFDEALGWKIKQDLKKDLQVFLPTRDSSRRVGSDILKPWNDLPNQKFEKILDSSYYRMPDNFPLPICSAKMEAPPDVYQQFLNERYLSLSMGSENFKFKDMRYLDNKFVKIIVVNKGDAYQFERFVDRVQQQKIHELKIAEDFKDFLGENVGDDNISVDDTETLVYDYIDNVTTDLDKDRIKKEISVLMTEAQSMEII